MKSDIIDNIIKKGDTLICVNGYTYEQLGYSQHCLPLPQKPQKIHKPLIITGRTYKVVGWDNYNMFVYVMCEGGVVDGFSYRESDGLFYSTFNIVKYFRKKKLEEINEQR